MVNYIPLIIMEKFYTFLFRLFKKPMGLLGIPFAYVSLYLGLIIARQPDTSFVHGGGGLFIILYLGSIWAFLYFINSIYEKSFGSIGDILVFSIFIIGIILIYFPYSV